MTTSWWEEHARNRIAKRVMPFPAQSRGEHLFKAAALGLILQGKYPSARQIKKRLGKDVSGRVNLNGRECQWLFEIREVFSIEPYLGYHSRQYRSDYAAMMSPRFPYKLRRGPKGALVVCDDWITNRLADERAALKRGAAPRRPKALFA